MKTIKTLLMLIMVLLVSVIACKKEEVPIPTPTPTINLTDQFFSDNIAEATQSFTVDLANLVQVTGTNGTQITINPSSFVDAAGIVVTGNIDFELIEAQTNKDMLMLNRPTFTNDGRLLVSGGIIYVNATQNGESLSLNPNSSVNVRLNPAVPPNPSINMQVFTGGDDGNGTFSWDSTALPIIQPDSSIYSFVLPEVGWINCDYFYNSNDPLTQMEVILPTGFDGSNSTVMVYYDNLNSVATLYDSTPYDGTFDLGVNYSSPVNMMVKFIVLAEVSGQWSWYVTASTPTSMNHVETIPSMTNAPDQQTAVALIQAAL